MALDRILIIDDDPGFLEITAAILRRFGYEVMTANGTAEGVDFIETGNPDLLILDIMMTTVDEGLLFASQLRQRKDSQRLPIIIVSAAPGTEKGYARSVEEDMDWISADLFMEKPVDPQALRHNIELLLKNRVC
jgi:CheY-like chemotaxis protein